MERKTIDQINEIVKQSLPQQVGEELRTVLVDYDKVKNDLRGVTQSRDSWEEIAKSNGTKFDQVTQEFGDFKKRAGDLDARELELEKRERNIDLALAAQKIDLLEKQSDAYRGTLLGFSRNTLVRKRVLGTENVPVSGYADTVDPSGYVSRRGEPSRVETHTKDDTVETEVE